MIDTDKYEGHTEGPWELIPNYEEGWDNTWEGRVHLFTTLGIGIDKKSLSATDAQLMADAPKLLAELKWMRELLYKCWKDSGESLYYLQVELLNDQEHWYQEMMCKDGSCEDCECDDE